MLKSILPAASSWMWLTCGPPWPDRHVEAVLLVGAVGHGLVVAAMLGLRLPVRAERHLVEGHDRAARCQRHHPTRDRARRALSPTCSCHALRACVRSRGAGEPVVLDRVAIIVPPARYGGERDGSASLRSRSEQARHADRIRGSRSRDARPAHHRVLRRNISRRSGSLAQRTTTVGRSPAWPLPGPGNARPPSRPARAACIRAASAAAAACGRPAGGSSSVDRHAVGRRCRAGSER